MYINLSELRLKQTIFAKSNIKTQGIKFVPCENRYSKVAWVSDL